MEVDAYLRQIKRAGRTFGRAAAQPTTRSTITSRTNTAIETSVVRPIFISSRGATGAPGSVPGITSPDSDCERTPSGSTANKTVNQIVR